MANSSKQHILVPSVSSLLGPLPLQILSWLIHYPLSPPPPSQCCALHPSKARLLFLFGVQVLPRHLLSLPGRFTGDSDELQKWLSVWEDGKCSDFLSNPAHTDSLYKLDSWLLGLFLGWIVFLSPNTSSPAATPLIVNEAWRSIVKEATKNRRGGYESRDMAVDFFYCIQNSKNGKVIVEDYHFNPYTFT